jgi:DNA (cytosine-5)-methyltransferase 1
VTAYYNEIDPYAAAWLRNLIAAGHIADGVVDERSIEDVLPSDLRGFAQCHFFAGIGVWSHALRTAGWADDRPVWTGSCPCQPFSDAGKGAGFADERHLWPAFFHLIGHHRPAVVFGEQVASKDAMPWLDLVQDDLEAVGYAFGAIPFPSAGVGAPHIRDRLYWVADADCQLGRQGRSVNRGRHSGGDAKAWSRLGGGVVPGLLGNAGNAGNEGLALGVGFPGISGGACRADQGQAAVGASVHAGELADADGGHAGAEREQRSGEQRQQPQDGGAVLLADDDGAGLERFAGLRLRGADLHDADGRRPVGGFWAGADWIPCRDNKWRPVEPGSFPLAHGAPQRMGRLRAYGNAINAEAARVFVDAYMNPDLAARCAVNAEAAA